MNKQLVTLCAFALCIFCTAQMNAAYREKECGSCPAKKECGTCHKSSCHTGCGTTCKGTPIISKELEKELCPKYYPAADIQCAPRKSLHKVQEVVCKNVMKEVPVCSQKRLVTKKRIVMVPHETNDTYEEVFCPLEKTYTCGSCNEHPCKCNACKNCHFGRISNEVKSDQHLTNYDQANEHERAARA